MDNAAPPPLASNRTPSQGSNAIDTISDVARFAFVGVAAIGLLLEQRLTPGDPFLDAVAVGGAAFVGAIAGWMHGRLDRNEERAARLRGVAWTVIRYFLAFEMVRYGAAKLVGMQFYPRYHRLDSRVVDLPPTALAWSFFGGSYGYQAFAGLAEVASAILLCFRRTTTLGACLLVAVMSNVVLVNFTYDLPVKLFSTTYLVMAMYLLVLDAKRLWAFFLGDGPVPPRHYLAYPFRPRERRGWVLHGLAVAFVLGCPTAEIVGRALQYRLFRADVLEGAWDIDRRIGLDDLVPAATERWDKIYFEKGDYGFIRAGERRVRFDVKVDEKANRLRLSAFGGHESVILEGSFQSHDNRVHIEGSRGGAPFSLDLTRDFPR
jgi:uncharacterized membrane protein YphA (DoxX/SURF4 family)